jgi:hypothetical protein
MSNQPDQVRRYTADSVLNRIDDETRANLARYAGAGRDQTDLRLRELEREWDTDRVIEAEGALTALTGLSLTLLAHRRFVAMPAMAAAAILLHAATGWHPLLPLLRRLGIRSAREIARERYALKVLRGDFRDLEPVHDGKDPSRAASAAASSKVLRAPIASQGATPEAH